MGLGVDSGGFRVEIGRFRGGEWWVYGWIWVGLGVDMGRFRGGDG